MSSPVTIAKATIIYTLTNGTIRITETPLIPDNFHAELPICCATSADALSYLETTCALDVNPEWYASERPANE